MANVVRIRSNVILNSSFPMPPIPICSVPKSMWFCKSMPRHIEQCDWLIAWEQNALWCNFVWAAFKRTVYVGKNRWIGNLTLRVDDADSGDDTAHIAHVDGWRDRKNACMLIGSSKHGSVVWPLGLENYAASYQLNADMLYLVTPSTYHCRPIYERDGVKRRFVRAVFYTE